MTNTILSDRPNGFVLFFYVKFEFFIFIRKITLRIKIVRFRMSHYQKQTNMQKIDNICKHIDEFNKTGLITDILNKTLDPILYLTDITEHLPYISINSSFTTLHVGQLKLLIGEIYLCTLAAKSNIDSFTFVYAGSSPNHKGFILNNMFPNMKTILIDPAEHLLYLPDNKTQYNEPDKILYFCCANTNRFKLKKRIVHIFDGKDIHILDRDGIEIKTISDTWRMNHDIGDAYLDIINKVITNESGYETYNNIIIEDYFTDNTAEFCKQLPNLIFTCDIRTNTYDMMKINTHRKKDITDLDICFNSAMMLSWINIMQPKLSMLKFRPPYYMYKEQTIFNKYCNTGIYKYYFDKVKHQIDFVADYKKKQFNYIIGKEILQAYAGTTSGETRLIFNKVEIGLINHLKRESSLFYYNQIRRQYGFHKTNTDPISGIDNCGDCALAQMIISIYLNKYNITDPDIISEFSINHIMSILRRPLNINNHGIFHLMNKYITDIYKQHGQILLNTLNRIDQPRYDGNQEAIVIPYNKDILTLVQKYINQSKSHDKFVSVLTRLLSILIRNYYIYNNLTTHEYCYYDLVIKRGLSKSDATKLLNELINKANLVKSI